MFKIAKEEPIKSNQMLVRDVQRKTKNMSDEEKKQYWDSLLEKSSIMDKSNWRKEIEGWILREDYFDYCDAVDYFCGCTLDILLVRGKYLRVYGVGYYNATMV